jgi:carboxyl-terminal processing protease
MKKYILIGAACLTLFGFTVSKLQQDKLFEISKNLEIFIKVYKELNTNFADELDPGILMKTAIDAMLGSLDPYTNFVSESQVESYRINQDEKYQGVGARVGMIDGICTILEPYKGGAAMEAGIRAGDQILAIDGTSLSGKNFDEISAIMRGVPGTEVTITVKKPGKTPENVKLTRGEVNIPNVPYHGMVNDQVGYISLTTFTANASANIIKAYKELKEDHPDMKGLILDLRDNGGGLLHEAIQICNIFLPQGEVLVTTKGKIKDRDQSFKTTQNPVDLQIPLAILINKQSASASEIVSGVIQDMDRGVIIGQRSYGKGLVQNTKNVGYNSVLKLTTSKYYIPSGRCIQSVAYENGQPKDIPDSQRSKFKTKNGRVVLDGGGITPDVRLEPQALGELTKALLEKHVIFNFVTEHIRNTDSISSPELYQFTDYPAFIAYVSASDFKFETETEKLLEQLQSAATKQSSFALDTEIAQIKSKVTTEKKKFWDVYRNEISREIEREIITRFYQQSGKVRYNLEKDPEVKEAVTLLNDINRYNKLLKK